MYIQFNKDKMHVQLIVGIDEKYDPASNKKIKEINEKVKRLREKLIEFQEKEVQPELDKIDLLVQEENNKFIKKDSGTDKG